MVSARADVIVLGAGLSSLAAARRLEAAVRRVVPAEREPAGRIRFAGTKTAQRRCGSFDGALEAGRRAADEVLEALRREPEAAHV